MKGGAMHLALAMLVCLVTLFAQVRAQTDVSGKWRIDPPPADRQQVFFDLAVDGAEVTGTVGQTVLDVPLDGVAIYEGRIEANVISFKTRSRDGHRIITFTGIVQDDQIAFTRQVDVRPGGTRGGLGIFGVGGPPRFTLKRVK
jgi:hypothetical protein